MHLPIRCMTCGGCIGQFGELFRVKYSKYVAEACKKTNTASAHTAVDPLLKIEIGNILDEFGIIRDCCRMTFTTIEIFTDRF